MKDTTIAITYSSLLNILENATFQQAIKQLYESEFAQDKKEQFITEFTKRLSEKQIPINIEVVLAKGGKVRKQRIQKQVDQVSNINWNNINYINHLIIQLKQELFEIPKNKLKLIQEHHKTEFTRLKKLYDELEEAYMTFEEGAYITDRLDFYEKYLRLAMRKKDYSISEYYAYARRNKVLVQLGEREEAYTDTYPELTKYMVKMFIERTDRIHSAYAVYTSDLDIYYKFMKGVVALSKIVKEKSKDKQILSYHDLSETKKKQYIKRWVNIHMDAYDRFQEWPDLDVEIGFIAGNNPSSFQNAKKRFQEAFAKKAQKTSSKKLPPKPLSNW